MKFDKYNEWVLKLLREVNIQCNVKRLSSELTLQLFDWLEVTHLYSVYVSLSTVRCEVPTTNKVFYELDQVTLDNENDIPRAADVVFVIQHAPCNRDVLEKIAGVADGIEKAMKAEGLTSTRFAVVGYGGKKSHLSGAHVHTMDGQIFTNTAKKVGLHFWTLYDWSTIYSDSLITISC